MALRMRPPHTSSVQTAKASTGAGIVGKLLT
jgi:hypothetical protein